jgi:hypothetical protein
MASQLLWGLAHRSEHYRDRRGDTTAQPTSVLSIVPIRYLFIIPRTMALA